MENHKVEAGVRVDKNGKTLTTIYCQPKTVEHHLVGVDLKKEE